MQLTKVTRQGLLHQSSPKGSFVRDKTNTKKLPIHCAIKESHFECTKLLIEQSLSSSIPFAHSFASQIFDNRTHSERSGRLSNNESEPMWERRNSVWAKFVDQFGIEAIRQIPAFKTFSILPTAIGNMPIQELESIIDLLDLDLAGIRDSEGQSILTVAIKKASEKEADWIRYFKPVLQLLNSKLHDIDEKDDHLTARGNEVDQNILWNAIASGLPWYGLKDICVANEDKMIVTDRKTGLYPFMMPKWSQGGDEEKILSLSYSYEMLRIRPDVIDIIVNQGNVPAAGEQGREQKRRKLC